MQAYGSPRAKGWSVLAFALLLVAADADAAGLFVYEMATPDLGTASAGRAAAADNAATAFGNPAGMARLEDSQLLVGLQGAYGISEFDKGSDTTVSGGNGGNAIGGFPGAGFYYVHSVSPDFKLGISTGSNFGLSAEYENGWSGRYYGTKEELVTLGAYPVAAYRVPGRSRSACARPPSEKTAPRVQSGADFRNGFSRGVSMSGARSWGREITGRFSRASAMPTSQPPCIRFARSCVRLT